MIKKMLMACAIILVAFGCSNSNKKQDISVLYVGYSPDKEMPEYNLSQMGAEEEDRYEQEYGKRMPSFQKLLDQYFTSVTTIDARDYKESESKKYDITIFDQSPTPVKERVFERDPNTGRILKNEPEKLVSDSFNSPSVFIGHTASTVGRSLGSKLDWYCLCLGKYAHHTNTKHEIFNTPYKVKPTFETLKTPEPIFHYFDGENVPNEIPMWKVASEDHRDGNGFRIGLVARGWGFTDSPDAEVISSGFSDKSVTAVALGRHGNFFLWGFAASPDYMTEEGKLAFVNAIVYTHKHRKDEIIAHKYNERIATKYYVDELLYYTTESAFEAYTVGQNKRNIEMNEKKIAAQNKKAAGEALDEEESMYLDFKPSPPKSREQYINKFFSRQEWFSEIGLDVELLGTYLKENRPYFYSEPSAIYLLKVDKDLKKLKVANTDTQMLDKAIKLIESGDDIKTGQLLLRRYTLESFLSAEEWRAWFEMYKSNLFFTASGGYVWMVDQAGSNPNTKPRSDEEASLKPTVNAGDIKVDMNTPTDTDPVTFGASIISSGTEKTVVLKANILEGYHIYAFTTEKHAYIKTEVGVDLPDGVSLEEDWKKSSPSAYPGDPDLLIYKGEISFTNTLKISDKLKEGASVNCWLYYQCCDNSICFPPQKKEITIVL